MTRLARGVSRLGWILGGAVLLGLLIASTQTCLRYGFSHGVWLAHCPDGEVRQTAHLSAPAFARGAKSFVTIQLTADYMRAGLEYATHEPIPRFSATLAFSGPSGTTPLTVGKWEGGGAARTAEVQVPALPDGDYVLRAVITSGVGETTLDVATPLFTPARAHVLTDRPLYEAGNTVKFRAVVLKASDLTPLDHRPGRWIVTSPSGDVLLEEKASAGDWGVVSGSFPLDAEAESGDWTVAWVSGATSETRTFQVRPFTLPRFRVEASPKKPFYRAGERPVLKGSVTYSSGAPVAQAKVELTWHVSGEWPPPPSWADGSAFPKQATADAAGAFTVELPAVPEDVRGRVTLSANIAALDKSGDRVEAGAALLLSEDALAVDAMTELEGGLVQGFNNRLYLRATTADGRLLPGATLTVKRLWERNDKGIDAVVDEDGVASLQLDPGPPSNVVVPAMPFRPPPKVKPVQRLSGTDQLGDGDEVSLQDRLTLDRAEASLGGCARYLASAGVTQLQAVLAISGTGKVFAASVPASKLGECVREALERTTFNAGRERALALEYSFTDEDLPRLELSVEGLSGDTSRVERALRRAMPELRDCLPATTASGSLPKLLLWRHDRLSGELGASWIADREASGPTASTAIQSCVEQRVAKVKLPKPKPQPNDDDGEAEDEGDAASDEPRLELGLARFNIVAPAKYETTRPQPTIRTGYELEISAKKDGEALGKTRLVMDPGDVPDTRLRATSQLLDPGASFTVELLRGPNFVGDLPEKLYLRHGLTQTEAKVDRAARTATFKVPERVEGWASVEWGAARLIFFVRPKTGLTLTVAAQKPRYAPGQLAHLDLETQVSGQGRPAAVGLFGVDESLGQLAALPGAEEFSGLRPQPSSNGSFGGLDAQALSLGRVRGANAIAATLLKVSALPAPPVVEAPVSLAGQTFFDPGQTLVDRFYVALGELNVQVREWESAAPKAERMSPRTMAGLWAKSLAAIERRKDSARDAYGRLLRLHRLPADLLALTEPRQVVIDGTRLPEDTENWAAWVAKEKP